MKLKTATIIAIAVVLVGLLMAVRFRPERHRPSPSTPMPPQQVASPNGTFGPPAAAMPDISKMVGDQTRMYSLMTQHRLSARLAAYVSQAKVQLVNANNTSLHYVLTYPDNLTSDETITIKPNQRYTPSAAELQKPSRSGIRIFNPTLTAKETGPNRALFTLHYFVLQSSLPADVQKWIQTVSAIAPPANTHFFSLVPPAWAQEGGGNGDSEVQEGLVSEIAKTWDVQMLEHMGAESGAKFIEFLGTFMEMNKSYDKMDNWMNEMKELEDCAKNPTNPLTQKASKTPEYQREVLDPLNSSALDVESAAFPILSNLTASALPQFSDAPGVGVILAPIIALNDEVIDEITEDSIRDARKNVVPCEDDTKGSGGSLEYEYTRSVNAPGNIQDINGTAKGTFEIKKAPGHTLFFGEGEGSLEWNELYKGYTSQHHERTKGPLTIWMNGTGDGTITATFNGENLTWTYACSGSCNNRYRQMEAHSFTRSCEFHNVDTVNGGTYEVEGPPDGTGAKQTCKLKLPKSD